MRIVSIKELHDDTGRTVRRSEREPVVITDRGRKVAIMKRYSDAELPAAPFPRRDPDTLPRIDTDSTSLISRDRDG
jgi:hypothetical protein